MDKELKTNLTSKRNWMRLIYMIIFAVCLQVSSIVMWVLVTLQFLFSLVTGRDNINLRRLGDSLSQYVYQALQFLTYASEEKPFPFGEWPVSDIVEDYQETDHSEASSEESTENIIDHEAADESESSDVEAEESNENSSEVDDSHTEDDDPDDKKGQ